MRYIVGVMGPAKARKKDVDNARVLGELIARREWVVLTGGRDVGVMDAACQGAKKVPGSLTIGVLPSARERVSKYVDLAINVVVVCGLMGAGTVSEVALALKAGKPVILVGATPAEEKFFKKLGGRLIASVDSPEEAIGLMMKQFAQQQPDLVQGARSWGGV